MEYKCCNRRILYIVIGVFGEIKGWIGITGCGFEIISMIMLKLYRKMPVLRNLEAILVGEKVFFQAGKKMLQKALLDINIKPKPLYISLFNLLL